MVKTKEKKTSIRKTNFKQKKTEVVKSKTGKCHEITHSLLQDKEQQKIHIKKIRKKTIILNNLKLGRVSNSINMKYNRKSC